MKNRILLFITVLGLVACNNSATSQDTSTDESTVGIEQTEFIYQKVSGQIFKEKLAAATEPIILDVRTPREVAGGTLPDATVINFHDDNFQEQLKELDSTKPVFVYCKSGGRSGQAMSIMKNMGFQEVYDLIGGYSAFPKE
jgi:rhodanese-related sulfurtransferase